ncbi:MAG: M23 family metallopeptidase [Leptospiraceae bacterium]|nr:M23 family metallopeptidase [Leptospiraceae bacterium]
MAAPSGKISDVVRFFNRFSNSNGKSSTQPTPGYQLKKDRVQASRGTAGKDKSQSTYILIHYGARNLFELNIPRFQGRPIHLAVVALFALFFILCFTLLDTHATRVGQGGQPDGALEAQLLEQRGQLIKLQSIQARIRSRIQNRSEPETDLFLESLRAESDVFHQIQWSARANAAYAADSGAFIDMYSMLIRGIPHRSPLGSDRLIVNSPFGRRFDPFRRNRSEFHRGLDLKGSTGNPVLAPADGVVMEARRSRYGYGNRVRILHPSGYTTVFAHLSNIHVTTDQTVRTGDLIGNVGSSGYSTGPHLHYEVRQDDVAINPQDFMVID